MRKKLIDLYLQFVTLEDYIKVKKYGNKELVEFYSILEAEVMRAFKEITELHNTIVRIEKITEKELRRLENETIYN